MQTRLELFHRLIFQITAIGLLMTMGTMATASPAASATTTKAQKPNDNLSTREYVEKYFSDIPVMVEVAKCESRFRQTVNGEAVRGQVNQYDRGVMQINELYHKETARKMGLDILTLEGNLSYARYLYEREGLDPWVSSSPCWKKSQAYASYVSQLAINKN